MAGLPKSIIKKYGISKRAWAEYRKAKGKSKKRTTKQRTTKRTAKRRATKPKGVRKMGKRKTKIPLFTIAGIIGAPAVRNTIQAAVSGNIAGIPQALAGLAGVSSGRFNMAEAAANIVPIVGGALMSKFIGGDPIGLNRRIQIPFVKF